MYLLSIYLLDVQRIFSFLIKSGLRPHLGAQKAGKLFLLPLFLLIYEQNNQMGEN